MFFFILYVVDVIGIMVYCFRCIATFRVFLFRSSVSVILFFCGFCNLFVILYKFFLCVVVLFMVMIKFFVFILVFVDGFFGVGAIITIFASSSNFIFTFISFMFVFIVWFVMFVYFFGFKNCVNGFLSFLSIFCIVLYVVFVSFKFVVFNFRSRSLN